MEIDIFEEKLNALILESQEKLDEINEKINDLEFEKVSVSDVLESYRSSLRNYLRHEGVSESKESEPTDLVKSLKMLQTNKERVLKIAQHSGELKMSSALDILTEEGYIKSKKRHNAYVQIYQLVKDLVKNGELIKKAPGVFRIK